MATTVFPPEPTLELEPPRTDDPTPLRAVHTPNFPTLLRQLGASLLVTTYQAGKLVLVRDEGDHLNTHFRGFQAPMGMALAGDRLAIGTKLQVWEFVDVPAVTAKLEPPGRHDACFLPRSSHVTGNIQIQEVFAVTVLPGRRYPDLINDDESLLENSFVVPDAALADVSPSLVERNSFRFPSASRANPSLERNGETE